MPKRILLLSLLALPAAAIAVPGGPIDSLLPGQFACEMPGDAASVTGYRVDAENFSILNANSYRTTAGRGTYLLTGDLLVLTSGPKRGDKYRRMSPNFLRKLDAGGKESDLRCVRSVVNNSGGGLCGATLAQGGAGPGQPKCSAPSGGATGTI
ncbi:MAG: elongation factor P [Novosphingobium sp.]